MVTKPKGAQMKPQIHEQLHALEDDIIQTAGLLKALHTLDCDDGAVIAQIQALKNQFGLLEQNFYKLWKELASHDNRS